MKPSVVVVLAATVGAALGIGTTWARFSGTVRAPIHPVPRGPDPTDMAPAGGPQPKVIVDNEEHDFGPVEREAHVSHPFKLTNVGGYPLTIESGGTSCMKCTISNLTKRVIPPGKSTIVTVDYHAQIDSPKFRQGATILTNDPERPRVVLTISGTIVSMYDLTPKQLVLSRVSPSDSKTVELKIFTHAINDLAVTRHEFTNPESADFFEAKIEPLPAEQLSEEGYKSGLLVSITLKPGLPLGRIQQTIRLDTNLPKFSRIIVPIDGQVASDISIVGPGWSDLRGALQLGIVSQAGIKRTVYILVRGPDREKVQVSTAKVEPKWLKVELGKPEARTGAELVQIPLTVEVPANTPPANYLGAKQGKSGEILLETTDERAKQLRVPIEFAVER